MDSYSLTGVEFTRWQKLIERVKRQWWALKRKLPMLVWHDDEVDVKITFTNLRLAPESKGVEQPDGSIRWDLRYEGDMETLWNAEDALRQLGLTFDAGTGMAGRDWEFDYSLRGPVKVRFRRRHKGDRKPKEPRPGLRLVKCDNPT